MASKGSPLLGDPVYGTSSPAQSVREAITAAGLTRQALHAAILGFVHPVTGEALRFETAPPEDMRLLEEGLAGL
jgi:23S rRNA pseudouridine1911/1915/1917 synthase